MSRFLAKVGKYKWAQFVVPSIAFFIPSSYMAYHVLALPKVRELFSVRDGLKERELTGKLRQLIDQVILDTKDKIHMPVRTSGKLETPMEFFLSVSPIYAGMTESTQGSIIGLPLYLEYETANDIPENMLQLTPLPFFKVKSKEPAKGEQEKAIEAIANLYSDDGNPKRIMIDVNTEDGQKYVNSLILSDNAKKFLIARQMFYTDTLQVMINFGAIVAACLLPPTLSRAIVTNLEPLRRSVSRRVPVYIISGIFGLLQGLMLKDVTQCYYDEKSDRRAGDINNQYMEGGIEYYTKCIQRNLAIRNMSEVFAKTIDEHGNLKSFCRFRIKELPLTERLEELLKIQKEGQKS